MCSCISEIHSTCCQHVFNILYSCNTSVIQTLVNKSQLSLVTWILLKEKGLCKLLLWDRGITRRLKSTHLNWPMIPRLLLPLTTQRPEVTPGTERPFSPQLGAGTVGRERQWHHVQQKQPQLLGRVTYLLSWVCSMATNRVVSSSSRTSWFLLLFNFNLREDQRRWAKAAFTILNKE